jgi:glucose-1-phosphate thymidylyltransferase
LKAVILAAGEGRRLRPFTVSRPKVMIPIANRPIIEYAVEALSKNGIKDIVIVVGYKKERIMSHFEEGKKFGVDIEYVTQQKPLGTAHALLQAQKEVDSEILVLAGDNLIDPKEVSNLMESRGKNSLLIAESDIPSKYGVVLMDKDRVIKIIEKPSEMVSNLISTGIYRFTPEIFDVIKILSDEGKHDLTEVLQYMIEGGEEISGIRGVGEWIDAVYPWDILHVNSLAISDAKMGIAGNIEEGAIIKGQVFIGEESVVRSGTYIVGPVVIGKGCDIGPYVCIFPSTSIGENVSIQPFTTIRSSVLMNDVQVGSSSTISNSVIGDGVHIGPNFVTNDGEALMRIESNHHSVDEIGVMIGEDSEIGAQVSTDPGTVIGAKCKISSSKKLYGSIPNRSIVV